MKKFIYLEEGYKYPKTQKQMYGCLPDPHANHPQVKWKFHEEKEKNSYPSICFLFTKAAIDRCFQTSEAYILLYFSWINSLSPAEIITMAILIIFYILKNTFCKIGYSSKLPTKCWYLSSNFFFFLHRLSGKSPICLMANHGFARRNSYFCEINPNLLLNRNHT